MSYDLNQRRYDPYREREARPTRQQQRLQGHRLNERRAEVEERAFMVKGAFALSGFIMDEALDLDDHRLDVVGTDEHRNRICARFEERALQQAERIQRGLFNEWGL
jgi:hypothetical protein